MDGPFAVIACESVCISNSAGAPRTRRSALRSILRLQTISLHRRYACESVYPARQGNACYSHSYGA